MLKILFVAPSVIDSCSFYRTGGIAPDLRKKLNADIHVMAWDKGRFNWQNILNYDLVMMQRPYTETAYGMGLYVKNLGLPLWVDYDDLLLEVPAGNRSHDTMLKARDSIKKITGIADAVSVTTELLRQELLQYNRNIKVIPNAFNDYIFSKRKKEILPERKKLILWRGSDTHEPDLFAHTVPILNSIRTFQKWDFMFLGYYPWFFGYHKNVKADGPVDPLFYFARIKYEAPTLLHVPLADIKFNRAKSNIAYIEASYAGSLCLAPDWDEWRMPGIMNYTDDKGYEDAIHSVIKGEVDVRRLSARAWEYVMDKLRLSKVNELRYSLVKTII